MKDYLHIIISYITYNYFTHQIAMSNAISNKVNCTYKKMITHTQVKDHLHILYYTLWLCLVQLAIRLYLQENESNLIDKQVKDYMHIIIS